MSDIAGATSWDRPNAHNHQLFIMTLVAVWGVALIATQNMPIFDVTAIGNLLRILHMFLGIVIVAALLPRISATLNGIEALIIVLFVGLVLFAGVLAFWTNQVVSPYDVVRMALLPIISYLAAKALDSEAALEKFFLFFYFLCLATAFQSLFAFVGTFVGYRNWGVVTLAAPGTHYAYGWYGLIGASGTARTMFLFSEASHYSQILPLAIFYAIDRGRKIGAFILMLALATTGGLAAIAFFALVTPLYCIRRRHFLLLLIYFPIPIYFLFPTVQLLVEPFMQFGNRAVSIADKIGGYTVMLHLLHDYPLGLGLVDLNSVNVLLLSSGGIAQLVLLFGGLIFPFILFIWAYLLWEAIGSMSTRFAPAIACGLLVASGGTITSGPWFTYWMTFVLGALVTYARIERAKGGSPALSDPEGLSFAT